MFSNHLLNRYVLNDFNQNDIFAFIIIHHVVSFKLSNYVPEGPIFLINHYQYC